jgi:hypothetical protein
MRTLNKIMLSLPLLPSLIHSLFAHTHTLSLNTHIYTRTYFHAHTHTHTLHTGVTEHDGHNGMVSRTNVEASLSHCTAEAGGVLRESLQSTSVRADHVKHLDAGANQRRGKRVREEIRTRSLTQQLDHLLLAGSVAASGATQRFTLGVDQSGEREGELPSTQSSVCSRQAARSTTRRSRAYGFAHTNVELMMSTRPSTPQYSGVPRPVLPTNPVA